MQRRRCRFADATSVGRAAPIRLLSEGTRQLLSEFRASAEDVLPNRLIMLHLLRSRCESSGDSNAMLRRTIDVHDRGAVCTNAGTRFDADLRSARAA